MRYFLSLVLLLTFTATLLADEEQDRKDAMIVQALLRLDNVDLDAKPPVKAALLRYMDANHGTEEYLDLAAKFELTDEPVVDGLLEMAMKQPPDTLAVQAARQLRKAGKFDRIRSLATGDDDRKAIEALGVIGFFDDDNAAKIITHAVTDTKRSVPVRTAAVKSLAQTPAGQKRLIELAKDGELPDDMRFTAFNALLMSTDESIRAAATEHVRPAGLAGKEPLPPIAELVKRSGNVENGKAVYSRSCVACHKVGDTGIDFGPALTEIGSKLAPPAMYEAILNPSGGISFGFEGFTVTTSNGAAMIGYIASETEDILTLRVPGGVAIPIEKSKVKSREPMTVSLMTPGLEQTMTTQELVDLVAYLSSLKKAD